MDAVLHLQRDWPEVVAYVRAVSFAEWVDALQQQHSRPSAALVTEPPVSVSGAHSAFFGTGNVNGYACGGDLPPCCVLQRESGGNPFAVEPGHAGEPSGDPGDPWHHASGLYQDMPSTWNNYRGYPYAAAAPPEVQLEFNAALWNHGNGMSNFVGDGCLG